MLSRSPETVEDALAFELSVHDLSEKKPVIVPLFKNRQPPEKKVILPAEDSEPIDEAVLDDDPNDMDWSDGESSNARHKQKGLKEEVIPANWSTKPVKKNGKGKS